MKKYLKIACLSLTLLTIGFPMKAQFYSIANQLPNMITPALSGAFNYKGYVEASYLTGLGNKKIDIVDISTSQGFKYSNWLYMGVGLGVDIAMGRTEGKLENDYNQSPYYQNLTKTGVMVPVFTDFRFNLGNESKASFFADVKLGASFLMGNNYLEAGDGYLTSRQYFYLKPSLGVRIPTNSKNPKQAFNVGVTYQLLTSNYWYYYGNGSATINALGVVAAYEW